MREILFRGKSVELNKNWVYGSLVDREYIVGKMLESHDDHCILECWELVDPETVGQYTGYETKEKKWFKGDILEVYARNLIGVIEFYNGAYYACDYRNKTRIALHLLFEDKAEIIGNIHDNPELLEAN